MKKFKYFFMSIAILTTMTMKANNEKPQGVDRANLDETVAAGDDFYQYACGGWIKANPLQPQYSRYGTFDQLAENNREQVKDLIQNLGKTKHEYGTIAQKVGDLYSMGMDSVKLNEQGCNPLKSDLDVISKAKREDFIAIIAWLHRGIASPFFGSDVSSDLMDSDNNIFYIAQSGMGLGDRDYYLENDANTKKIRTAYINYIETLFKLSGWKPAAAKKAAKNVLKIETELAKVAMSREDQRDLEKQYNMFDKSKLESEYPNIDWTMFFNSLGLKNVDKINVCQVNTMAEVNNMLKTLPEAEIKDYLAYNYMSSASSSLSDEFNDANFEMFSKTLSGKTEKQPRWKRAVGAPNGLLGEAVGQLYVDEYFPGKSKEKMLELVNNLKIALAEHIANLPWMSDKTKVNALVKLNSLAVKVGYPDKWKDYSKIEINPNLSYWENIKNATQFHADEEYAKYGKPVDKSEWHMTPQTVNAYYNPTTNEICFPAGILQAPYFDVDADDASNYGAIGVVIGHEMTHGFDDMGRKFDQNGNMVDWWTEEDADKFKSLTDVLVNQFNAVEVAEGVNANGLFTLGENIADQGGLNVSYTAFKKTDQGKKGESKDGFTPEQRFFISYANVWAGNITEQEILRRTKTDPHSLGKWRVNATLKNVEPFIKAFNVKEGDAMFIAPSERVMIW